MRYEQGVARLVGRVEVHDHHQIGRALGDGHTDVAHLGRQPRLGDAEPVLHLHLRDVEVGAEVEGDRDGEAPVGGGVRGHIEHVLDAVDLLLDRRHHGGGYRVRGRVRYLASDVDDRRRDLGILRDRQAHEGDRTQDHEDDRDHRGEDRPVDEEVRETHRASARFRNPSFRNPSYWVVAWDAVAGGGPCSCAFTLMLGRARIRPLTITRSSATRPSLMTRWPSTSSPSVTYFWRATPSPSTASTYLRACSLRIALSGRSSVA